MTTTEVHRQPIDAICAQLGVPPTDWPPFSRWAAKSLNSKALDQLHAYVDVMIADRCRKPGPDLLSQLIRTGIDAEELTVDELRAVVAAMVSTASAVRPGSPVRRVAAASSGTSV